MISIHVQRLTDVKLVNRLFRGVRCTPLLSSKMEKIIVKKNSKEEMLTDQEKIELIKYYYSNEKELSKMDAAETEKYLRYVDEGCEKGWVDALVAKAYGCYGGNGVFSCDWEVSRDCFLKLIEIDGENDPFYYNSLGYIYYYGRCNNGEPEYDKAFQYFTIGAVSGIYESRYKLADMISGGKGVPKNLKAAATMIISMYDENYDIFCKGNYDGKFADVSLRMGGLYERGAGVDQNLDIAYYHYLQAAYAIKKRMEIGECYGDGKVKERIDEALIRVKAQLSEREDYFLDTMEYETPAIFGLMLQGCAGLDIVLEYRKGKYYLKGTTLAAEDDVAENLITIAAMNYCELHKEVEMRIRGIRDLSTEELPFKAFVTHIVYNDEEDLWEFYHGDYMLLSFGCKSFIFNGV